MGGALPGQREPVLGGEDAGPLETRAAAKGGLLAQPFYVLSVFLSV